MEDKKFTTEQLEEQCEEARKAFVRLKEQLEEQKRVEEEQKQAELARVKEVRKKEVEDAFDRYNTLFKSYVNDYGYCSISTDGIELDSLFGKTFWRW